MTTCLHSPGSTSDPSPTTVVVHNPHCSGEKG
jgi:hypothetical protein